MSFIELEARYYHRLFYTYTFISFFFSLPSVNVQYVLHIYSVKIIHAILNDHKANPLQMFVVLETETWTNLKKTLCSSLKAASVEKHTTKKQNRTTKPIACNVAVPMQFSVVKETNIHTVMSSITE